MNISYLIDTDWVISQLHGKLQIQNRLLQLQPDGLGTKHKFLIRAIFQEKTPRLKGC